MCCIDRLKWQPKADIGTIQQIASEPLYLSSHTTDVYFVSTEAAEERAYAEREEQAAKIGANGVIAGNTES